MSAATIAGWFVTGGLVVASGWALAWWEARRANKQERRADGLQAALFTAEERVARLEKLGNIKHSDELVNKWFATSLDYLPAHVAEAIRGGMRAEREHGMSEDSDKTRPGRKPLPLPPPTEDTGGFITGSLS